MNTSVVLVEPEKAVNLGQVARLVDNFGAGKLILVDPKLNPFEMEVAEIVASHSMDRIKSASRVSSLSEALSASNLTIATSSRTSEVSRNVLRRGMTLQELREHLAEAYTRDVAFVFGRDGIGLTREEIAACDLLVNVEADSSYPVLNLASAVSIVLYESYISRRQDKEHAEILPSRDLRHRVVEEFERLARRAIRQPYRAEKAVRAFSNALVQSAIDERQTTLILGVLRKSAQRLEVLSSEEPE